MPTDRYFLENSLASHTTVQLSGAEFHHFAHVLRKKKGDVVELINGKGTLAKAAVEQIAKNSSTLLITEAVIEPRPPLRLILAQALCKQNRLDFILEKGTEMGVDAFWLFPSEHASKQQFYPNQIERCQQILQAAIKQCGRLHLPSLIIKEPLVGWENTEKYWILFGDLNRDAPFLQQRWKTKKSLQTPIVFVTGPEGGLSEHELFILKQKGAEGARLHPLILRAETASLMAIGLLSHWLASEGTHPDA